MLWRCAQTEGRAGRYYGGRGITVCERWRTFANFLADMGERPAGMTLDRIDSDGNYEPGNCRWATAVEQARASRGPKAECKRGHPMQGDGADVYVAPNGNRRCRTCHLARMRARRAAARA
jgi:hypothetical protein